MISQLDPASVTAALRDVLDVSLSDAGLKTAIPRLAKNPKKLAQIEHLVGRLYSRHRLLQGDARRLEFIPSGSIALVVTSPPYWTLKEYVGSNGQLGDVSNYEEFITEIARVWTQCHRVLQPGGRLVIVVGDVCLSRREHGRHSVVPLHASISERCRTIGFENLATLIWHKISNARFEVEGTGAGFLGKPYEPNAVIKNDIEFILMLRKSGGYRKVLPVNRLLSVIGERDHREWFQQIWHLTGASTRDHPAPYPLELAERLIRMFSFCGDTVLDPFVGTGTTMLAAAKWGRHSIGVDIEPSYVRFAQRRLAREFATFVSASELVVENVADLPEGTKERSVTA